MSSDPTLTLAGDDVTESARVPVLTLLAHHDPSMVGARALLRRESELGRGGPTFQPLGEGDPRPLGDPFLSRTPVLLAMTGPAVHVSPNDSPNTVELDGVPCEGPVTLQPDRLERGVVLTLRQRVAILLHLAPVLGRRRESGDGLVGASDPIARVRRDIGTAGPVAVPVLIRGESGVGKELVAQAVHRASTRSQGPFEAVNMAAVPPTLAASELFGHERGAFTGADRAHDGYFRRADGGTLFLDEIGDAPAEVQTQLLRVLETSEVRAVGSASTRKVDVRLISATDADLERAIGGGSFREALLQRLAGFQIHVPPLRERRDDIGLLVLHFARQELEALGRVDVIDAGDPKAMWLTAPVVARLARHDWPGNVRELRNVVRQLVIASRDQPRIGHGVELEPLLGRPGSGDDGTGPVPSAADAAPAPAQGPNYRDPGDVTEEELLLVLRNHGWRLTPAAKALNLSRTSLYALVDRSAKIRKASDLGADEIRRALEAAGDVAGAAAALEVSTHALKLRMKALSLED